MVKTKGVVSLVSVMKGYPDGEKVSKYSSLVAKRAPLSSPFATK